MSYIPNVWSSNDLVTAAKMNHIEDGISSALTRAWEIEITTSQWTFDDELDKYKFVASLENIDEATWIDVNLGDSNAYLTAHLYWQTDVDTLVFSTENIPNGTLNITVAAWGTMEGGSSDSGVVKAEGIYPVYTGELSAINKNSIVCATGGTDLPTSLVDATAFTVITQRKSDTERAQFAFAYGGEKVVMRVMSNGTYGNWFVLSGGIADDLVTNDSTIALSAKQGKVLKDSIDALEEFVENIITVGPSSTVYIDHDKASAKPFKNVLLTIKIDQNGSGTPSASNVRSFKSYSSFAYYIGQYVEPSGDTIPIPPVQIKEISTWPNDYYSGVFDVVNEKLIQTHGHIASYNGESLPGMWYSSMDVYSEVATPTIGAEVVYELAEPTVEDCPYIRLNFNASEVAYIQTGEEFSRVEAVYYSDDPLLHQSSVVDDLNSTATDKPLSANRGRELDARLDKFSADSGNIWRLDATDINTIKQTGNYYANNNCPNAISGGGYLTVLKYDDSYVVQTMYSWNSTNMFVRVLNNGVWSSWQRKVSVNDIVNNLTNTSTDKPGSANMLRVLESMLLTTNTPTEIPSNADLDNYRANGVFYVPNATSAATISNIPEQQSGRLVVFSSPARGSEDFNYGFQIYFQQHSGTVYIRNRRSYGPYWTNWTYINNPANMIKRVNVAKNVTMSAMGEIKFCNYSDVADDCTYNKLIGITPQNIQTGTKSVINVLAYSDGIYIDSVAAITSKTINLLVTYATAELPTTVKTLQ